MTQTPFRLTPKEAETLHRQLEAGYLLPTEWYADAAIFQAELEQIHRRSWCFATHTGELGAPGDVFVRDIAGVPILLVRADDGSINGFLNICRHRNHPVVTEAGNRRAIRCHFHGWTYALDGRLRHAPRGDGEPAFDPACFGLVPIQTHVWGPMVWVNLDLEAPSFERWIEGLPELVAGCGLDVGQHAIAFEHTWEIDCNWKVFQDNTIECYHCPTTHPELARALEMKPEKQEFWVGGRCWIHHRIPFRDGVDSGLTYQRVEGQPFYYYYHWIFPGTYLQFSGKGFDIGALEILAADKIRFRHICFLPRDTPDEVRAKGQAMIEVDPTIWQDVALCNAVQKSHASGRAPQGRVFAAPEFLLSHFHHLIVDMMTEPPAGRAAIAPARLAAVAGG